MKKYLYLFFFCAILTFISCSSSDEDAEIITVASARSTYFDPEIDRARPIFLIKKRSDDSWTKDLIIDDFNYEPGFEYTLLVKPTEFRTEYSGYVCIKVLSKVQKESENLPSDLWKK